MNDLARFGVCLATVFAAICPGASAGAPRGKAVEGSPAELEAAKRIGEQLKALIVWSTSRESGSHDIWIMNADGSDQRPLTKSNAVDWFARFSPDGKLVSFTRSKAPWQSEMNAQYHNRWDIWVVNTDGTGEKKLVSDATWGTWTSDGKLLFSRGGKVFTFDMASSEEKLVLDGDEALKPGVIVQQPQMSPDGKYIAATLRGRMRETGVWSIERKSWTTVGGGCQINWFPSGDRMIRMNENTGRGGTEVFAFPVKDGAPANPDAPYEELRFMDLPGARSHEYFPVISRNGRWMVWCATDRGHDHDIYDYEVFIWRIGSSPAEAARLTFHTGNDRWPDIFVIEDRSAPTPTAE